MVAGRRIELSQEEELIGEEWEMGGSRLALAIRERRRRRETGEKDRSSRLGFLKKWEVQDTIREMQNLITSFSSFGQSTLAHFNNSIHLYVHANKE